MQLKTVKVVEMPGATGRSGRAPLGYGEARIYRNRASSQGIDLTSINLVRLPLTVLEKEIINPQASRGGSPTFTLSDEFDYIAFMASRPTLEAECPFDMEYYVEHLKLLVSHFKPIIAALNVGIDKPEDRTNLIITFTTPGTYSNPDQDEANRRNIIAANIIRAAGFVPDIRYAPADTRAADRYVADIEGVSMDASTVLFIGARNLVTDAMNKVMTPLFKAVIEKNKYSKVVTTLDVGANLKFAEVATSMNIPVQLVYAGADANSFRQEALQERIAKLVTDPNVTVIGKMEYQKGKRTAVTKALNAAANDAGAYKLAVETPESNEARILAGATNMWDLVLNTLRNVGAGAEVARLQQAHQSELPDLDVASIW